MNKSTLRFLRRVIAIMEEHKQLATEAKENHSMYIQAMHEDSAATITNVLYEAFQIWGKDDHSLQEFIERIAVTK